MFCIKCNAQLNAYARFCEDCGTDNYQARQAGHNSASIQSSHASYGDTNNQASQVGYGNANNHGNHVSYGNAIPPTHGNNRGYQQHGTPAQAMYCVRCRYQLVNNSYICAHCGTNNFQGHQPRYDMSGGYHPHPGQNMHCPHCSSPLVNGMVFCGCCGSNVGNTQNQKKDISKEVLTNGITDIVLGAIDIFVALWLSSHIQGLGRTRVCPQL